MLLFRCKIEKLMYYLFLSYICRFFVYVLIYNKDKIKIAIVIINAVIIYYEKGIGGKDATSLVDFALEPSETHFISELSLLTLSNSNGCSSVIFRPILTNHTEFWKSLNG